MNRECRRAMPPARPAAPAESHGVPAALGGQGKLAEIKSLKGKMIDPHRELAA